MGIWLTDHALWVVGFIAVASACLLLMVTRFSQGPRKSAVPADVPPPRAFMPESSIAELAYRDPPTMRVATNERIDRLHKRVTLRSGEFVDVLEHRFGKHPRLRITLSGIERASLPNQEPAVHADVDVARMQIEIGGANAGCGAWVTQTGANEFLMPLLKDEEHCCSVFHFMTAEDSLVFIRVHLVELDRQSGSASFDVLQVCGQWQGTTRERSSPASLSAVG